MSAKSGQLVDKAVHDLLAEFAIAGSDRLHTMAGIGSVINGAWAYLGILSTISDGGDPGLLVVELFTKNYDAYDAFLVKRWQVEMAIQEIVPAAVRVEVRMCSSPGDAESAFHSAGAIAEQELLARVQKKVRERWGQR